MLDNDTLAGDDAEPIEQEEVTEQPPEEEAELVISIEGEEPEADPDAEIEADLGDKGKAALKALREAQRKTAARNRELEAELAKVKTAAEPKPEVVPEPTLEECNWNEQTFKARMAEHLASVDKQKAERERQEAAQKAAEDDYHQRFTKYRSRLTVDLRATDADEAEAAVKAKLTVQQQSVIIRTAEDPAQVILALGRNPKVLDALAGQKDLDRFAYQLAKTEGKIKVTQKSPPPAESKLRAGVAGGHMSLARQLEMAEAEADRTGDRTKVIEIRRKMREAGQS